MFGTLLCVTSARNAEIVLMTLVLRFLITVSASKQVQPWEWILGDKIHNLLE